MDKKCKFPAVMSFFEDGFGEVLVQALADSIENYVRGLEASGCEMCENDVNNIVHLVWLLKAVLKDVHSIG